MDAYDNESSYSKGDPSISMTDRICLFIKVLMSTEQMDGIRLNENIATGLYFQPRYNVYKGKQNLNFDRNDVW